MNRFTILTVFLIACLGAFGVETAAVRARVDFRENSHQEPEVTLL